MSEYTFVVALSKLPVWIAKRFENVTEGRVDLPYCWAKQVPGVTVEDEIQIHFFEENEDEYPREFPSIEAFLNSIPDEKEAQAWEAEKRRCEKLAREHGGVLSRYRTKRAASA